MFFFQFFDISFVNPVVLTKKPNPTLLTMAIDPELAALWNTAIWGLSWSFKILSVIVGYGLLFAIPLYITVKVLQAFYRTFYVCVPQGFELVVERYGKFHRVLTPGVHFWLPFVDWPKLHSLPEPTTTNSQYADIIIRNKKEPTEYISSKDFETYFRACLVDTRRKILVVRDIHLTLGNYKQLLTVTTDATVEYKVESSRAVCYEYSKVEDIITHTLKSLACRRLWEYKKFKTQTSMENTLKGELDGCTELHGVSICTLNFTKLIRIPEEFMHKKYLKKVCEWVQEEDGREEKKDKEKEDDLPTEEPEL